MFLFQAKHGSYALSSLSECRFRGESRFSKRMQRKMTLESLEARSLMSATPFAPDWVVDLPTQLPYTFATASDSNGNLVIAGRFEGTVDFDPGPAVHTLTGSGTPHKFLAKYDSSGALVAAVDLGNAIIEDKAGLAIDNTGAVYLAAGYYGVGWSSGTIFSILGQPLPAHEEFTNMFVVKIASNLQTVDWITVAQLESSHYASQLEPRDLAVNSDGTAVYVNGFLSGEGSIGPLTLPRKGFGGAFVSKLNGVTGQFEWVQTGPACCGGVKAEITVDPTDANAVYHSRNDQIFRIDSNGNQLWQRSYANVSWNELAAQDGSLFLAGSFSSQAVLGSFTMNSAGQSDIVAARLSASSGNVTWASRAGGAGNDIAAGIGVDGAGNLFLSGEFDGSANFGVDTLVESSERDAYVSQLDASTGSFIQSWRYSWALDSQVTASGGSAYVAGKFYVDYTDFPNGYVPTGTPDEPRTYFMHFSPAADPTVPRINGFVVSPDPVEQGDPLSLSAVGMFDRDSRVDSVSFYRDVNLNRRLDAGTDLLVGIDGNGVDGWGIIIPTTGLAVGDQQFFAQATYDGGLLSLAVSAATFVREPFGAPVTYQSTDVPKQIQDLKTVVSTLSVADSFSIADVDVTVSINHQWNDNLDVYLIHPDGTRIELFTDVGSSSDNFLDTTLDDDTETAITSGQAPFTGRFRPEGLLSALDGRSSFGAWRLEIRDDQRISGGYPNQGQLVSWSLSITPAENLLAAAPVAAVPGEVPQPKLVDSLFGLDRDFFIENQGTDFPVVQNWKGTRRGQRRR